MPKLFISHSNHDDQKTLFIVESLRRAGFAVWVDFENIRGGADWLCEIQAGIERCDAVVTILSKASLKSVWVERECLFAFQLKKPVFIALVDQVHLPLLLINIQYCDCRGHLADGVATLIESLSLSVSTPATEINYPLEAVSGKPIEANFFPYVEQLPQGGIAAMVAKDLFHWARQIVDEVAFGGKTNPACHARITVNGHPVTLFSLWAYPKTPSLQVAFDYLSVHKPFNKRKQRRALLKQLNQLLPKNSRLCADKADRRPTIPLELFAAAETLEAFKQIISAIIDDLRANA